MKKFFITGTDTGIGKTYVSCALLHYMKHQGFTTLGIKPLATGCERTKSGLRNADALQLQEASTLKLPYEIINPVCFADPIAPSIAAEQAGVTLNAKTLFHHCQPALAQSVDFLLIEGIGGWRVPLNHQTSMADFVKMLKIPVILVVGMKLGCLNHALLTWEIMRMDKIPVFGWVANCLDNNTMQSLQQNIHFLKAVLGDPLFILNWKGVIEEDIQCHLSPGTGRSVKKLHAFLDPADEPRDDVNSVLDLGTT